MPEFLQGDIFQVAIDGSYDLAIVFGHIGFNQMALTWRRFCETTPAAAAVRDPFAEHARSPQEFLPGRWFWFVPEGANHGMGDDQVTSEIDRAVGWAEAHFRRPATIITNGIAEAENDANDDRRAHLLAELARGTEGRGHRASLINLSNVFVQLLPLVPPHPIPHQRTDNRLQIGYGSSWHMLRCLGWQRDRFSNLVAAQIGAEKVTWLDFPPYFGDQVYPASNPILDAEWKRLDFLAENRRLQVEYDGFWPTAGSQQNWDAIGLARFGAQHEWLLVEAKAHVGEVGNCRCGARGDSLRRIRHSLDQTRRSMGSQSPLEHWLEPYYQFANRLATLYFLNEQLDDAREPAR
ncbi:MAG TPA: hypothetical protein PK867_21600, partial [Pirellulales bacterium]|nr:hypothetical protein [Pirellulales bacterium]